MNQINQMSLFCIMSFLISQSVFCQIHYELKHPLEVSKDIIVTLEMVDHFPKDLGAVYFSQKPPYLGNMYYRETSFDTVKKYMGGPMSMYLTVKREKK